MTMKIQGSIQALTIYPLKSAQGVSVASLEVTEKGPKRDREWMLVDKNNTFISQRNHPRMGEIETSLTDSALVCKAPTLAPIEISFEKRAESPIETKIFGKPVAAELVAPEIDQWFSDFLGTPVRLVRAPQQVSRKTSGRRGPLTLLQFADGYPFLLTNQATLDELNTKLDHPVSMARFRPNIVIEGPLANIEDQWTELKIGDVDFLSVKACTRCSIINRDPKTGEISKEVTKTLATYRTKEGQVVFGANLSHTKNGTLSVGDKVFAI